MTTLHFTRGEYRLQNGGVNIPLSTVIARLPVDEIRKVMQPVAAESAPEPVASLEDEWARVLRVLERRTSRSAFNTWLRPLTPVSVLPGCVLRVPDKTFIYWLSEYYTSAIERAIRQVMQQCPERVVFEVTQEEMLIQAS